MFCKDARPIKNLIFLRKIAIGHTWGNAPSYLADFELTRIGIPTQVSVVDGESPFVYETGVNCIIHSRVEDRGPDPLGLLVNRAVEDEQDAP